MTRAIESKPKQLKVVPFYHGSPGRGGEPRYVIVELGQAFDVGERHERVNKALYCRQVGVLRAKRKNPVAGEKPDDGVVLIGPCARSIPGAVGAAG